MNRRSVLIGAGASALAACATAPSPDLSLAGDLDARIAGAMARIEVMPGLAVAVYSRQGVYARGFGVADLETRRAANADTAFYIASCTKGLTALALAVLHARGAFDLDATLAAVAPDANFPSNVHPDEVRFRDLLRHTSGVSNRGIAFRVAYSGEHDPATLWRLLAASQPNTAHPLGAFDYTNEGYNIATVVTDRRLGVRWQDLLAREIFAPAGMTRSSALMSRMQSAGVTLARPYFASMPGGPERVYLEKADQTMQSAGGVVMSANDAVRWLELMIEGGRIGGRQVVPAAAVAMVQAQQVAVQGTNVYDYTGYGMGWYLGSYRDERLLNHFGGYPGCRAHISFLPERGIGVACFVNDSTGAAPLIDAIANYVYDATANRPDAQDRFEKAVANVVDGNGRFTARVAADRANRAQRPWTLTHPRDAYAGVYVHPEIGVVRIAVSGDQIEARCGLLHAVATPFTRPDALRVELIPGQAAPIQFEFADGARPTALTMVDHRFIRQG